jgi:hypothetical protein
MFNRNIPWKRPNDFYRHHAICLGCMILAGQFATAQDFLQRTDAIDAAIPISPLGLGNSIAGERIASVTCDPFMSASQWKRWQADRIDTNKF